MTRSGCRPQRTQRANDTLEFWDPRGSAHIVDWRRTHTAAESRLRPARELDGVVAEINRRHDGEPHTTPRQLRWLALRLDDGAASGWRWGLIIDDRLLVPTRPAAPWIERGAAPPQHERAGTWWRIACPDDHWTWYVGAGTLELAVRRALHATAPIPTTIHITRWEIRHDLLIAVVDATPPERPTIRLVAQDLGGPHGPGGRWGCLLARDLDNAETLCT